MKALLWACVALLTLPLGATEETLKGQMIRDLETIRNEFEVGYAPTEWKKSHLGWDLEVEFQKAKDKILQKKNISNQDFQKILKEFFRSAKDDHVSIRFYSTEKAELPFAIKGVEGHYYVTYVDTEKLVDDQLQVGDELISFDGKSTHAAVVELQKAEFGNSTEGTDRAKTEIMLTRRSAKSGIEVPQGPVVIEVKQKGSNLFQSYQLRWDYTAEEVTHQVSLAEPDKNKMNNLKKSLQNTLFQCDAFCDENLDIEKKPHEIGARKSFIPDLGIKIWESSENDPFYAYIYQTSDKHLIGYVRIPSYAAGAPESEAFGKIIRHLQNTTEALVIDQINNPGGSVFYLYGLLAMLTDHALATPQHCFRISHQKVHEAAELLPALDQIHNDKEAKKAFGETVSGYPVSYQMVQFQEGYLRFIQSEWKQGRTLTEPFYLWGVDCINPHPKIRYNKPILVLINELDFSGADFFPAILQDNKRAKLLGTRTAGAGGYITRASFHNRFGIEIFSFTGSIAYRVEQNPIENLGVKPDILYSLTQNDLQNGYGDYIKAINQAVTKLLSPN